MSTKKKKKEYTPVLIDILMMNDKNTGVSPMWNNEFLSEYVEKYMTPSDFNEGYFDGPYLRLTLINDKDKNNKFMDVVLLLEPDAYSKLWPGPEYKETDQGVIDQLFGEVYCLLFEDIYFDRGEQFCFSKQGKYVANFMNAETRLSPDIGIRPDDSDDPNSSWGFCT